MARKDTAHIGDWVFVFVYVWMLVQRGGLSMISTCESIRPHALSIIPKIISGVGGSHIGPLETAEPPISDC